MATGWTPHLNGLLRGHFLGNGPAGSCFCLPSWPRNCHPANFHTPYDQRSTPLHTWARACFEQGSLPSLLAIPGKAAMLVLPGDKMFQSQFVTTGKTRPVILHGYGNAKKAMKEGLISIAAQGWKPMASAMVGVENDPPIWACNHWRPILGTSVDVRVSPEPLTAREEQLLLSRWVRIPLKKVPISHAAHTWLHEKLDLPKDSSPDCSESPHSPVKANQICKLNQVRKASPRCSCG